VDRVKGGRVGCAEICAEIPAKAISVVQMPRLRRVQQFAQRAVQLAQMADGLLVHI
jgi:hypothetical protein